MQRLHLTEETEDMDSHTCDICEEKFQTRAELAMHRQTEHAHQSSDGVIAGQPPKEDQR